MGSAERLGEVLRERGLTISTAESCTGGGLAARITSVPGSSDYFLGSVVAYQNAVKVRVLGVPEGILEAHGAVSRETAAAMATGCRRVFQSDLAVGITGIAGPEGGSDEKPVGLVYVAVADRRATRIERLRLDGNREEVRLAAIDAALDLILSVLIGRRVSE